jgi:hypothetical protein
MQQLVLYPAAAGYLAMHCEKVGNPLNFLSGVFRCLSAPDCPNSIHRLSVMLFQNLFKSHFFDQILLNYFVPIFAFCDQSLEMYHAKPNDPNLVKLLSLTAKLTRKYVF